MLGYAIFTMKKANKTNLLFRDVCVYVCACGKTMKKKQGNKKQNSEGSDPGM